MVLIGIATASMFVYDKFINVKDGIEQIDDAAAKAKGIESAAEKKLKQCLM